MTWQSHISTVHWRTKNYTISYTVQTISTQSYTQSYIAVQFSYVRQVPTLTLWHITYGRIRQTGKVTGLWMLFWRTRLYWGWVEGTGDPVLVMNIELVCVQVIFWYKRWAGFPTMDLKSLMSASAPNSSIVQVRSSTKVPTPPRQPRSLPQCGANITLYPGTFEGPILIFEMKVQ